MRMRRMRSSPSPRPGIQMTHETEGVRPIILDTEMRITKGTKLAKFQRVGNMARSTLRVFGPILPMP